MDNDLDACTLRTVNDEQCPAAESTAAASTVTTEDLDPPSFLPTVSATVEWFIWSCSAQQVSFGYLVLYEYQPSAVY
jgi:hypothetical protein